MLTSQTDAMRGFLALSIQSQLCEVDGAEFVLHTTDPNVNNNNISDHSFASGREPAESDVFELSNIDSQPERLVERGNTEFSHIIFAGERSASSGVAYRQKSGSNDTAPNSLRLEPSDLTRLERAGAFLRSVRERDEDGENDENDSSIPLLHPDYKNCLSGHGNYNFGLSNRYNELYGVSILYTVVFGSVYGDTGRLFRKGKAFFKPELLLLFLPLAYGTIHLLAWEYCFPSDVERYTWRVSSVIASSTQLGVLPVELLIDFYDFVDDKILFKDILKGKEKWINPLVQLWEVSILALFLLLSLLNIASRVFLTVESFVSLRSLPIGSYAMPAWLQMMPHL